MKTWYGFYVASVPKHNSVADLGSGDFLIPGSGIGFSWIPDLGSWIPKTYFWELLGVKSNLLLCQLAQIYFLRIQNQNNFQLRAIRGYKKGRTTTFFPRLFCCFCWIWDPGIDKNQDPGSTSWIRTTDTQSVNSKGNKYTSALKIRLTKKNCILSFYLATTMRPSRSRISCKKQIYFYSTTRC